MVDDLEYHRRDAPETCACCFASATKARNSPKSRLRIRQLFQVNVANYNVWYSLCIIDFSFVCDVPVIRTPTVVENETNFHMSSAKTYERSNIYMHIYVCVSRCTPFHGHGAAIFILELAVKQEIPLGECRTQFFSKDAVVSLENSGQLHEANQLSKGSLHIVIEGSTYPCTVCLFRQEERLYCL